MKQKILKWLQLPMAVLFLWAAWLQTNDPDPALWSSIYIAASLLSLTAFFRWGPVAIAMMFGAGVMVGCLYLSWGVIGQQHLFDSEEGREMMGLLIIGLWMGGIVWLRRQSER